MPVSTVHASYSAHAPLWAAVRDCIAGQSAVKAKGPTYLPIPDPDNNDRNSPRYQAYLQRALFMNVVGRTLNTLVGAAFRKEPEVELPTGIEYIREDADNSNNSLIQLARSVVSNVASVGRHGLLVDYPAAPEGMSREDVIGMGLRPVITEYAAESIINWHLSGGMLDLVVLQEISETTEDGLDYTSEVRYRVLRLVDGAYVQELYDDGGTLIETMEPRKADGSRWDVIPFVVPGSVNNDAGIDPVTLYDLAAVNIAHYRNSADAEENVFLSGQAMLHIDTGTMSAQEWQTLNPNGVQVGARRGIVTNGGGSAAMLQPQASGIIREAMQDKEKQMLMIGARLITEGGANQTAEAVRANMAAETSVLETIVRNCGEALELCLRWVCEFAGANVDDVTVSMNTEFFSTTVDPQMLAQMMGLESIGIISREVILSYLRRTGVVDDTLTDEEIMGQVEAMGL
jgi:hypothetical protein